MMGFKTQTLLQHKAKVTTIFKVQQPKKKKIQITHNFI